MSMDSPSVMEASLADSRLSSDDTEHRKRKRRRESTGSGDEETPTDAANDSESSHAAKRRLLSQLWDSESEPEPESEVEFESDPDSELPTTKDKKKPAQWDHLIPEPYIREPTAILTDRDSRAKSPPVRGRGKWQTGRGYANRTPRGKGAPKFNEAYLDLLNEDIEDARTGVSYPVSKYTLKTSSQILGSTWTHTEKVAFFEALPRTGRDNYGRLAEAVGSKSPVECAAFVEALEEGLERYRSHLETFGRKKRSDTLVTAKDIPAAVEISEECIAALDAEAAKLDKWVIKSELLEIGREKKWQKGYEVLDEDIADDFAALYDEDLEKLKEYSPASELLNTALFLGMANKYYMFEDASIRHQALSDFHTLAVSLTRRIVHVALFQARTRLKVLGAQQDDDTEEVEKRDIQAAIKILGLTPDSKEFWRGFARRNDHEVYSRLQTREPSGEKKRHNVVFSHDRLEQILQTHEDVDFEPTYDDGTKIIYGEDEDEDAEDIYDPIPYIDEFIFHRDYSGKRKEIKIETKRMQAEEKHLEYIDKISSLKEEIDLWIVLGAPIEQLKDLQRQLEEVEKAPCPVVKSRWRDGEHEWRGEVQDRRLWQEPFYGKLWRCEGFGERRPVKKQDKYYSMSDEEISDSEASAGDVSENDVAEETPKEWPDELLVLQGAGEPAIRRSSSAPSTGRNRSELADPIPEVTSVSDGIFCKGRARSTAPSESNGDNDDDSAQANAAAILFSTRRSARTPKSSQKLNGFVSTVNNVEDTEEESQIGSDSASDNYMTDQDG